MYWLLGLTFLHVVGEGGLALFEAIRIGSLALLAFGLESVIEGGAALLAVRHLRHLSDEEEDHAHRDQVLARWIGVSFLLLATYTTVRGALEISGGTHMGWLRYSRQGRRMNRISSLRPRTGRTSIGTARSLLPFPRT
jgi:hypothetical protein